MVLYVQFVFSLVKELAHSKILLSDHCRWQNFCPSLLHLVNNCVESIYKTQKTKFCHLQWSVNSTLTIHNIRILRKHTLKWMLFGLQKAGLKYTAMGSNGARMVLILLMYWVLHFTICAFECNFKNAVAPLCMFFFCTIRFVWHPLQFALNSKHTGWYKTNWQLHHFVEQVTNNEVCTYILYWS